MFSKLFSLYKVLSNRLRFVYQILQALILWQIVSMFILPKINPFLAILIPPLQQPSWLVLI